MSEPDDTLAQILARIEEVANTTTSMRGEFHDALGKLADRQSGFFAELGKTRGELMERMQAVRDDVTVNLAAARIAEQAGRGALAQGNALTDALAALTIQVRRLQERVDALQNGKGSR